MGEKDNSLKNDGKRLRFYYLLMTFLVAEVACRKYLLTVLKAVNIPHFISIPDHKFKFEPNRCLFLSQITGKQLS